MLVSHTKKFIFIHNYKVAGTSIREVLGKYRLSPTQRLQQKLGWKNRNHQKTSDNHQTAQQIQERLPEKVFNSYYKFGFVRDPWDWQASLYKYALRNKHHKQHQLISSMASFEEYLLWRVQEDFRLQKAFFYDKRDKCLVDFVGRYEQLSEDFGKICKAIGIKEQLPHRNQSQQQRSYLDLYDERTLKLVNEYYAEDIHTFDYEFPTLAKN
ncbi:MAG: sulfotransferase family 2 domain-containing protein [Bacteroidota bacterium]